MTAVEGSSMASSSVLRAFFDMRDDVVAAKAANNDSFNDSYNHANTCYLTMPADQDRIGHMAPDAKRIFSGKSYEPLGLRCRASNTTSLGKKFECHRT
jgi:hypothetical protein